MEWSTTDAKRAAAEGWRYTKYAGFSRIFDLNGDCPFASNYNLFDHIRKLSALSKWHRQVYLDFVPWTIAEDFAAKCLGWGIFTDEVTTRNLHLFPTNEDAKNHVVKLAEQNDPLAVKALTTLARRRLINIGVPQ